MDIFELSKAATKAMLKKQFYSNKLSEAGRNPVEWITELELLCHGLKSLKVYDDDIDLDIYILNNLSKEYESLV